MIKGVTELGEKAHELISGSVDGQGGENDNSQTYNTLVTKLTGSWNGTPLAPLDGGPCGGDLCNISDNQTIVIQIAAAKSKTSPVEIHITIQPFSQYFALNAVGSFDQWRQENLGTFVVQKDGVNITHMFYIMSCPDCDTPGDPNWTLSPDGAAWYAEGQLATSGAKSFYLTQEYPPNNHGFVQQLVNDDIVVTLFVGWGDDNINKALTNTKIILMIYTDGVSETCPGGNDWDDQWGGPYCTE